MSNQIDPFSNYLNIESIRTIDKLNLPIIQKQHVRILAHCLALLKDISFKNSSFLGTGNSLKEWCNNQSQRFNDPKFSDLLYNQLELTSRKLHSFSQRIGKNIKDLDIEDLVILVKES